MQIPNIFTSFSQNFFWQFFSWNQSCQQLKSLKPQHFHEFFTPKKSTIFSGNQSWIFGQKMKISNSLMYLNQSVSDSLLFCTYWMRLMYSSLSLATHASLSRGPALVFKMGILPTEAFVAASTIFSKEGHVSSQSTKR